MDTEQGARWEPSAFINPPGLSAREKAPTRWPLAPLGLGRSARLRLRLGSRESGVQLLALQLKNSTLHGRGDTIRPLKSS
jgi:hypothetical protein